MDSEAFLRVRCEEVKNLVKHKPLYASILA